MLSILASLSAAGRYQISTTRAFSLAEPALAASPLAVPGQHHQAIGKARADLGVEEGAPFRIAHLVAVRPCHAEQQLEPRQRGGARTAGHDAPLRPDQAVGREGAGAEAREAQVRSSIVSAAASSCGSSTCGPMVHAGVSGVLA